MRSGGRAGVGEGWQVDMDKECRAGMDEEQLADLVEDEAKVADVDMVEGGNLDGGDEGVV